MTVRPHARARIAPPRTRDEVRKRIVEEVTARGELYSADIASSLGIRCASARHQLDWLASSGLLVSRFVPASEVHHDGKRSGLGRRYYRIPTQSAGGAS